MLSKFKVGDTVWVEDQIKGRLPSRGEVLRIPMIGEGAILVRVNNQELYCEEEELSSHFHPWENNDGVYITPAGCPCRVLYRDEKTVKLEVYDAVRDKTEEYTVKTQTFLNQFKCA